MLRTWRKLDNLQSWFDLQSLQAWRSRLVDFTFVLAALLFPLSIASNLPVYLHHNYEPLIIVDLVIWLLCLLMALGPLRRFARLRLVALLVLLYAMTATFFLVLGPSEARPAWLVLCSVYAALLFGLRAALASVALNVVLLLALFQITAGQPGPWQDVHTHDIKHWVWFVTNSNLLALVAGSSVGLLLGGLARSLEKERAALLKVREETQRRKWLEDHLQRAQKLEAIGRFASGIAHDLNNMLMPIIAYTEMAADELPESSRTRDHLDAVLRSGLRASELVAQILTFGRAVEPERGGVKLLPVLAEVRELVRPKLPKDVRLDIQLPEDTPPPLLANRTALVQVLQNLSLNAIDAMPDGGRLSISVSQETTPLDGARQLCIQVEDEGVGMDEATAARAFDPFFSTKEVGKGSGLGLALVHGIVTALGGAIELHSRPGQGSRFCLHLPLADQSEEASAEHGEASRSRFRGMLVLVDDDEASRTAIASMLQKQGFHVDPVSSGAEALERLEATPQPHLLITDWLMPHMGGDELAETVRQRYPELPILAVSGSASPEMANRIQELGILGLLPKPFTQQHLHQIISDKLPELLIKTQKT